MSSGVRGLGRQCGIGVAHRPIGTDDVAVWRSAIRQFQAKPACRRELASIRIPIRILRQISLRSSLTCRCWRDGRYQGCRDEHFESSHWRILHSPPLRERSRRRPLLPGRSRRILNTDDVGIVVGNPHRTQITIPRMQRSSCRGRTGGLARATEASGESVARFLPMSLAWMDL